MGQVVALNDLAQTLAEVRTNKKIVFTNGCFDILHIGHVKYLQEARALGDILVVGMDTDESVRGLKGPSRPVQSEQDRSEILAALGCVDYVCLFGAGDPRPVIKETRPDILVKGGDWAVDQILGSDFVMSYGGQVKSLKFIEGRSTTNIVDRILDKN